MPVEIPMPKFYRNKEMERDKLLEYIYEKKEEQQRKELQNKGNFKGVRDPNVWIDEQKIDLTDTPDNVAKQIKKAMNVSIIKADYILTEQKIDEIRSGNANANETSQSIFTSTLEKFINNVGLKLPYDSDPGFYQDHYDREVKARYGLDEHDNLYADEGISGVPPEHRKADN